MTEMPKQTIEEIQDLIGEVLDKRLVRATSRALALALYFREEFILDDVMELIEREHIKPDILTNKDLTKIIGRNGILLFPLKAEFQTKEVCDAAIKNYPEAFIWVRADLRTAELFNLATDLKPSLVNQIDQSLINNLK